MCGPSDTASNAADQVGVWIDGWLDSPGHRASLMRTANTYTGVGVAVGSGVRGVQVFCTDEPRLIR